jgi:hypothetical protein
VEMREETTLLNSRHRSAAQRPSKPLGTLSLSAAHDDGMTKLDLSMKIV